MAKVKISKWDANVTIPLSADQEIKDLAIGEEITMTMTGKVKRLSLEDPDEYDKERGIDKSGSMTVLVDEVTIGEETTEFEIQTQNYDVCCDD